MRNMALDATLGIEVCRCLLQIALGIKFRRQKFNAVSPNTLAMNLNRFMRQRDRLSAKHDASVPTIA